MTRAKRPLLALIISCLALAGLGVVIWQIPPLHWWIELGAVSLLAIAMWLGVGWGVGKRKLAAPGVIFLLVTLLLNRLGILNWITLGLWVAVVGLISLIN